jgi:uncharacterized protein with HEPN domain
MAKDDFLADKRTQQAVISLIVIGEAATKVMDGYVEFTWRMPTCRGAACAICVIAWLTAISTSTSMWCETVQEWLPALLQQLPAVRSGCRR